MIRENGRDEEPRELGRVPEGGPEFGSDGVVRKAEEDWASWGAEDPAFFIKPSDRE